MLWLVAPMLDWEDAEHAVGAIGGAVEIGLSIYRALTGKDEEGKPIEPEGEPAEGEQTLGDVLQDHEDRLAALEKPKRRRRRAPAKK